MHNFISLVVILPLLSALAIPILSWRIGQRISQVSSLFIAVTLAAASINLWQVIVHGGANATAGGWASLFQDPLSAMLAWVISGFSLIVHLYSRRYMVEEAGYTRFFILLDLMTCALLAMVTASNLILLLVAWHLVGVLLYLLLGLDLRSKQAQRYAFWTLFTYRIGDLPMVLAAGLLFHAYGTWSLPEIFAAINADPQGAQVLGMSVPAAAAFLIALSAFARSAQFFTHTWLPYTMSGPTPVSALMHAGIVNAGGFLVNRFAPVFIHATDVLHLMFVVGLVTAIVGSVLMLTQHDIKKSLGYSTMGQMGFMIMECGVGAFSLAVYHLIAHGVFKGTMFLSSGGVIHNARSDDGVPEDDLYTFVVARKVTRQRRPWLAMAAFTLAVPAVVLFLAHYLVEASFFEKQGAVVLLFFGWMTGAQLIFSTYHLRTENLFRLFSLILVSFAVVVLGYAFIAHAFDLFLYPDTAFRAQISDAAGVKLVYFDIFAGLLAGVIVLGWLLVYYADQQRLGGAEWYRRLRRRFYGAISREFYIGDIYGWVARATIAGADRVNGWLRWR